MWEEIGYTLVASSPWDRHTAPFTHALLPWKFPYVMWRSCSVCLDIKSSYCTFYLYVNSCLNKTEYCQYMTMCLIWKVTSCVLHFLRWQLQTTVKKQKKSKATLKKPPLCLHSHLPSPIYSNVFGLCKDQQGEQANSTHKTQSQTAGLKPRSFLLLAAVLTREVNFLYFLLSNNWLINND